MTPQDNPAERREMDWPQVRDMFEERLEALRVAEVERSKALTLQWETDAQRVKDLEKHLAALIEHVGELARTKDEHYERAIAQANEERGKSAQILRDQLQEQIRAGDINLNRHIDAQVDQLKQLVDNTRDQADIRFQAYLRTEEEWERRQEESTQYVQTTSTHLEEKADLHIKAVEKHLRQMITNSERQVHLAFDASEKAIQKAEIANEKRFEDAQREREQVRQLQTTFLTRELFDQALTDQRRRQDANLDLIQNISTRITEIEARGGGQQNQSANFKSTVSVLVAVFAALMSAGIGVTALVIATGGG